VAVAAINHSTRDKIITCAYQIIGQSGYQSLSTRELIKQVGISKGTLYHHFDCVDDVIYAAMEKALYDAFIRIEPNQYKSLPEWLEASGCFLFEEFFTDKQLNNVMYSYLHICMFNEKYRARLEQAMEEQFKFLSTSCKRYFQDQYPDELMDRILRLMDIVINGMGIHVLIINDIERQQLIWQDFTQMVLSYIDAASHNNNAAATLL